METKQPDANPLSDMAAGEDLPPEAYRKCTQSTVFTVIFGIIVGGLAMLAIANAILGGTVIANPDGDIAQQMERAAAQMTAADFWSEVTLSLVLFGVIPTAWVALTRVDWQAGTLIYLHMTRPANIWKEIGYGVGLVLAIFALLILLVTIQGAIAGNLNEVFSENETDLPPIIQAMDRVMTLPLAFAIAFAAAVGEEIFFRGVLQRWLGWWGQAIVFGLTHASYGTIDQILVPFAIGLAFGYIVKRGQTIWMLIIAHFLLDFVQLAGLAYN